VRVDCTIIVGEVRSDEEGKRKGFREKKRNWVKEEEEEGLRKHLVVYYACWFGGVRWTARMRVCLNRVSVITAVHGMTNKEGSTVQYYDDPYHRFILDLLVTFNSFIYNFLASVSQNKMNMYTKMLIRVQPATGV
jgi:hypothetical protein